MTESAEPSPSSSPHADATPPPRPPGTGTFTLEGRAAPGLYFVGWLGTIVGLGTLFVALLSGGRTTAAVLAFVGIAFLAVGLVAAAGSQALERRRRGEMAAGRELASSTPAEPEARASEAAAVGADADASARTGGAEVASDVPAAVSDASSAAVEPGRTYRGPSPFLVFLASLPVTVLVVGVLIVPFVLTGTSVLSPAASLLSVVLTSLIYLVLVRLLVVGTGALSWRAMGLRRLDRDAVRDLFAGAVLAVPILLLTVALGDLLVTLIGATPDSPLPLSTDAAGFVANLIAAAVIAPIGEEIFFRGFSTTAWARGMGENRGLIRGALFFALVHVLTTGGASFGDAFGRALVAFLGRVPVSFALGWIFLRRRSLYASIGLHATFNATLVVLAEVASRSVGF